MPAACSLASGRACASPSAAGLGACRCRRSGDEMKRDGDKVPRFSSEEAPAAGTAPPRTRRYATIAPRYGAGEVSGEGGGGSPSPVRVCNFNEATARLLDDSSNICTRRCGETPRRRTASPPIWTRTHKRTFSNTRTRSATTCGRSRICCSVRTPDSSNCDCDFNAGHFRHGPAPLRAPMDRHPAELLPDRVPTFQGRVHIAQPFPDARLA